MDSTICHVCGVESSKFRKKCLFNDHVKSHQSDRKFICPYCGKCYQHYYSLLNHQNKYHSTISNTCETCGSNFSAKSHLERHKKVVHERSNNFVCEVCTKSFSLNEHLKRHLERCTGNPKKFTCEMCHKVYGRKESLNRHIKNIHETNEIICEYFPCILIVL